MISAIALQFGGEMHSAMKQIAIENGFAWPIFAHTVELFHDRLFHDRLGPGLRDDIAALTLERFQVSAWNVVWLCTVPWSRLLCKMAMLGQFLRVPQNFKIFHDRLGPGRWLILGNARKSHFSVSWSGSLFEIAMLSQCLHFLILAGQGCRRSLNILFYLG